ncbi:MAG: NADH-quinone oxidoreductase subunit K [Desulfurococcaceae archaeon]
MAGNMEQLLSLMLIIVLTTFMVNIGIALYGVFVKRPLIKKLMALVIFNDSVNILAIALGFRTPLQLSPSPPVLPDIPKDLHEIETFVNISVDPLLQAFVITAVVIGLSIIMFMLGLVIKYYERFKTMDLTTHQAKEEDVYEEITF